MLSATYFYINEFLQQNLFQKAFLLKSIDMYNLLVTSWKKKPNKNIVAII